MLKGGCNENLTIFQNGHYSLAGTIRGPYLPEVFQKSPPQVHFRQHCGHFLQ